MLLHYTCTWSNTDVLCDTCKILLDVIWVSVLTSYRYEGLDRFVRLRLQLQPKSLRFVGAKVATDALVFGPLDLVVFFTYMGLSSGKSVSQVKEDVKRDFIPAFVLGGGVWPIVQVANFKFVPVRYQLLYVNIFCLLDSAFLSWLEQQQDAPWKKWFASFLGLEEKERQGWLLKSHQTNHLYFLQPHHPFIYMFLLSTAAWLVQIVVVRYSCKYNAKGNLGRHWNPYMGFKFSFVSINSTIWLLKSSSFYWLTEKSKRRISTF